MIEQFRPHHIFYQRSLELKFPERGEAFAEAKRKAIEIVESHEENLVEAIEGVDQICRVCLNNQSDRCENPASTEDAVRKWDAIISKGLGIAYGEIMTAKQWRTLIGGKAPLHLCTSRCPYRAKCTIAGP